MKEDQGPLAWTTITAHQSRETVILNKEKVDFSNSFGPAPHSIPQTGEAFTQNE